MRRLSDVQRAEVGRAPFVEWQEQRLPVQQLRGPRPCRRQPGNEVRAFQHVEGELISQRRQKLQ